MACRDVTGIRSSVSDFGDNLRDSRWGVPFTTKLPVIAKQLDELREVRLPGKNILDSALVKVKTICRKLETIFAHRCLKSIQEFDCRFLRALAHNETRNKFRLFINCNKKPLVAKLCGIIAANALLFLETECPYLIALDMLEFQVLHSLSHESSAFLPGHDQQIRDRIAIQSCESLCGADGATLKQTLKRFYRITDFYPHHTQRRFRLRITECRMANLATVSLRFGASETKLLHFRVSAGRNFGGFYRTQHG